MKIEFTKETTTHIVAEKSDLDRQIKALVPFEYEIDSNKKVTITYELCMTLIDGKVLNVLTGTKSTQCCPLCGATPTQFLTEKKLQSNTFKLKPSSLQYGISPLHGWIRLFEHVLNVSHRIGIYKWHIKDMKYKDFMTARKLPFMHPSLSATDAKTFKGHLQRSKQLHEMRRPASNCSLQNASPFTSTLLQLCEQTYFGIQGMPCIPGHKKMAISLSEAHHSI